MPKDEWSQPSPSLSSVLEQATTSAGSREPSAPKRANRVDALGGNNSASAEALRRYRVLVNSVQEAVLTVSRDGRIRSANQAAVNLLHCHVAELLGKSVTEFIEPVGDGPGFRDIARLAGSRSSEKVCFKPRGGEDSSGLLWASALEPNPSTHFLLILQDISRDAALHARLEYARTRDHLTGLLNRWTVDSILHERLESARFGDGSLAVLRLDMDRFQSINDLFGHTNGDVVLSLVAHKLRSICGAECVVGRLDGDEFLLVTPLASEQSPDVLAANVLECVTESMPFDDHSIQVGVSIGVAVAPEHGDTTDELLKASDLALAEAKARGKNQYRMYQPSLGKRHQYELGVERDLRSAVHRDEVFLHYQPIVNLHSGNYVGAEALARWGHPGRGLVSPETFIPIAERSGIITMLGAWIMDRVVADLSQWSARPDTFYFTVNISPRHFRSLDLVDVLDRALDAYGVRGEAMVLEITEGIILDDVDYASKVLRRLRARGFRIAVDDFGTGYSSLRYLRSLPVDILKIDRSFLTGIPDDGDAVAIVEAILSMGSAMGLAVVAEGVERAPQVDFLRERNCSHAQGFYFRKPCALEELLVG